MDYSLENLDDDKKRRFKGVEKISSKTNDAGNCPKSKSNMYTKSKHGGGRHKRPSLQSQKTSTSKKLCAIYNRATGFGQDKCPTRNALK